MVVVMNETFVVMFVLEVCSAVARAESGEKCGAIGGFVEHVWLLGRFEMIASFVGIVLPVVEGVIRRSGGEVLVEQEVLQIPTGTSPKGRGETESWLRTSPRSEAPSGAGRPSGRQKCERGAEGETAEGPKVKLGSKTEEWAGGETRGETRGETVHAKSRL